MKADTPGAFALRDRMIVAYETGLRTTFINKLSVPEHYRPGGTHIFITRHRDKNGMARAVKLTQVCREALDRVCPDAGLVFGKHDYRDAIGKAARAVLSPTRAAIFAATHFRSASATHDLERTTNVAGVMFKHGWKQIETPTKYMKASSRAGDAVVQAQNAARKRGGSVGVARLQEAESVEDAPTPQLAAAK